MTCEVVFPPSVNWNLPQIADSNEDFFIYGAKNRLVVLTIESSSPGYLKFVTQFDAHKEKVSSVKCLNSLSLVNKDVKQLVASAGDDGIRLWDLSCNESPVLHDFHSIHRAKPITLSWKDPEGENSENYLASGDIRGIVILYSVNNRNYLSKSFENESVTCLEFAPVCQNRHILAVAYKNGVIAIVNTEFVKLELLTKVRSTDEKIENISWCPFVNSADLASNWVPNLLATSATTSRAVRFFHVNVSGSSARARDNDTKFLFCKRLPVKVPGGKSAKGFDAKNAAKSYFFAYWAKKDLIILGSLNGELVRGDVSFDPISDETVGKNENPNESSRRVSVNWEVAGGDSSVGHSRVIQSITLFRNQIITQSVDRYLCLWNFPNLKNVFTISTFGGSIFGIDISPVSKSWVAIASGGGFLYVWNCGLAESSLTSNQLTGVSAEKHDDRFRMQHVWQGGKVKVNVVCFHPKREGLLAFGTEDGKVAVFDVCSNKSAITSVTFHTRTVYSLSWGPEPPEHSTINEGEIGQTQPEIEINAKNSGKHFLYSCGGEGVIYIHNPSNMSVNAVNLNDRLARTDGGKTMATDENRSVIQWHASMSLLAVGNLNGTIDIYNRMLQLTCVVELHGKTIYHVAWQPWEQTSDDDVAETREYMLAVSCKSENIVRVVSVPAQLAGSVSSASEVTSSVSSTSDVTSVKTISELTCELIGHKKKLGQVSWSVHNRNHLLSTSNDGTVQIWSLENKNDPKPVCNYPQSKEASATSAKFSLNDPDLVFSSGTDFMMHCWRPSKQISVSPPTTSTGSLLQQSLEQNGPEMLQTTDAMPSSSMCHVVNGSGDAEAFQETKVFQSGNYIASDFENIRGTAIVRPKQDSSAVPDANRDVNKYRKKKAKTMLKISSTSRRIGSSVEDTRRLFEFLTGDYELKKELINAAADTPEHGLMYSGIFCGNLASFSTVQHEICASKTEGDLENVTDLLLAMGNVEEAIDFGIANGCLRDKHAAASFLGGFNLWRKCVDGLHKQHLEAGNINDAANYLLMLNRVYDAMKLYQEHGKHREALALGAMRLPPTDEFLKKAYLTYASLNENNACEVSAQGYLAAWDFLSAARTLSTRNNLAANLLALDILLTEHTRGNVPHESIQYLSTFCVVRQLCQMDIAQSKETASKCGPSAEFDTLILSFELLLSSIEKVFGIDLIEEFKKSVSGDKDNAPETFRPQEQIAKISADQFESRNANFVLHYLNRFKIELDSNLKIINISIVEKLENFLLTSRIPQNLAIGKDLLHFCLKVLTFFSQNPAKGVETNGSSIEDQDENSGATEHDSSREFDKITVWVCEKLKPVLVAADANGVI